MLDANLYTLNFVRSANEPDKLFLIEESTGDPAYFRLKAPEGTETRLELYHAPTLAPLGALQTLSSKLRLISLPNPSTTIELKNSGYIHFEWTFHIDNQLKFCWRKDIVGLAGSKRGFTCWMSRKPDPDYPCAIYRPGSSTVPPSCQFLDFNIRRIENLSDPRGFQFILLLSLLSFTEALADHDSRRSSPSPPPSQKNLAPGLASKSKALKLDEPIEVNELRISDHSSGSELVSQGLQLFEDPLVLYLSVHAPAPKYFKQATTIAEQIKRDRLKKSDEELYQYLVDDIMSQEMNRSLATSSNSNNLKPSWLKIYLSRIPLDELLPKSATKSKSQKPLQASFLSASSKKSLAAGVLNQNNKPRVPPKESKASLPPPGSTSSTHSSLHSRLLTGVHRPFSKIFSSQPSRSSAYYYNSITPYYLDEDSENEKVEKDQNVKAQGEKGEAENDEVSSNENEPQNSIKPDSDFSHHETFSQELEKFFVCVNEFNLSTDVTRNNRVLVKDHVSSNASSPPPQAVRDSSDNHTSAKEPEKFFVCVNELNPTKEVRRKNRRLIKSQASSISQMTRETSPLSYDDKKLRSGDSGSSSSSSSSRSSRMTKSSVTTNSTNSSRITNSSSEISERSRTTTTNSSSCSIKSSSSTIRSTASSFVEIILSSCCPAYRSAFDGNLAQHQDDRRHSRSLQAELEPSPSDHHPSSWKRFSYRAGHPQKAKASIAPGFVSNMFSKKTQFA